MLVITTARWLLGRAVRSPVAWLLVVLTAAAWPLLIVLFSLGITTSSTPPGSALYEIGFVACQLGGFLAAMTLSQGTWWMNRTPAANRLWVQGSGVFTGCFALICAAWLAPVLVSGPKGALPIAHMASTALLASLHMAALGLWILALPIPALGRALAFPLFTWILPSTVLGLGAPIEGLRQTFEIAADFEFPWFEESPATPWLSAGLSILGLILLRIAFSPSCPCATPSSETSTPT